MKRRLASVLLMLLGAALLAALLWVAHPGQVLALARRASLTALATAFAWYTLALVCRGLRLALVSGGRLTAGRATLVIAAAQLPIVTLPMRLGELAFFPALRAAGVPGAVRGLGFLVLLRALDVASLLAWGLGIGLWMRVPGLPLTAALVAVVGTAAYLTLRATRTSRRLVLRLRRGGGWRRKLFRQLLQVRRELLRVARSPWRALAVVACSVVIWSSIWALTVALLRGMSLQWPADAILLGMVGAAVGSAIPLNAAGSFGTQEAGWAAALATVGVPTQDALAAGFASHSWSVIFAAVHCAIAVPILLALRRRAPRLQG